METRSDVLDLLENQRESLRQFGVRELGFFGSFARNEQTRDSDVDVLVDFLPGHGPEFESYPAMLDELRTIMGRPVDLVEKSHIRGSIRRASRDSIARSIEILFCIIFDWAGLCILAS